MFVLLVLIRFLINLVDKTPPFPSHLYSPIYCYGDLLDAVQRAEIFRDSKEFVDRPLVANASQVLEAFSDLPANVSKSELRDFVLNWTRDAGSDIETWTPGDWIQR